MLQTHKKFFVQNTQKFTFDLLDQYCNIWLMRFTKLVLVIVPLLRTFWKMDKSLEKLCLNKILKVRFFFNTTHFTIVLFHLAIKINNLFFRPILICNNRQVSFFFNLQDLKRGTTYLIEKIEFSPFSNNIEKIEFSPFSNDIEKIKFSPFSNKFDKFKLIITAAFQHN